MHLAARFPAPENPVLIEVTRGALVECRHRGALAVASSDGRLVLEIGNIDHPAFPRSAIKPLQALPLIESGAADRFRFEERHIALAVASHSGTSRHVAAGREMVQAIGMEDGDLRCGVHVPRDQDEQRALLRAEALPTVFHHNCSGKHAGMLATARHLGERSAGYEAESHPVQKRVRETLEQLSGESLSGDVCGIDGCSVPNWAMKLRSLAVAYARFATGADQSPARRQAAERIIGAAYSAPEYFAGPNRFDTRVLKLLKGAALVKTGAEGAYAGAFPELGLGFALKIDDGASRAAEAIVSLLIEHMLPAARGQFALKTLKNGQGRDVGLLRASPLLEVALS